MKTEYLFVYGTLIGGVNEAMNALVKQYGTCMGSGSMNGKLYEVLGYPGFKYTGNSEHKVFGEVYMIRETKMLFEELDHYEESSPDFPEPREYRRVQHPVRMDEAEVLHAWVYEYALSTNHLKYISGGNYQTYLEEREL